MSAQKQKIQFFQSQSSFGSDSVLSQSRYYDFINQIISESENIFLTLQKQLLPTQNMTKQDTIKFALTRAQIIEKDTIPEHLNYLNKIQAPQNAKNQVKICSEKLKKLLEDYQKLKQGTMIYKQFYNLYGKQFGLQEQNFNKKKDLAVHIEQHEPLIQPQYIQINYNGNKQKLRGSTPRILISSSPNTNEKQLSALKQEIYKLKKVSEDIKKKNEAQLINERITYEKRLRNYLQSQNSPNQEIQTLKSQLKLQGEKLTKSLELNKSLMENVEENNRIIQTLKADNASLKQQIQALRKVDNSMIQEEQNHDKSYNSDVNQIQDKRMTKKLKNLKQQNQLLKTQLRNERQRLYKLQSDLTDEERRQLQKNKRYVQKQKNQLQELYNNLDKHRIQSLQLSHSNKTYLKLNQTLKHENSQFKKIMEKLNSNDSHYGNVLTLPILQKSIDMAHNKTQILQYQGDGIEGIPYYQNLSKQFKIRFRRSCLRQKQLLYKLNGIEIGTISVFEAPNKINILVHITNYSQHKYEKVKIKIMNANENKINGQSFEFVQIASNQQIKLPISLIITRYPIGPLVLLLEYFAEKKEQLRILLPAHIFKTMNIEQRSQTLHNKENKIILKTQRKIAKDLNDMKIYFKNIKVTNGKMQLALYNQHTHTLINLDLIQTHEGLDIYYQHKEGNRNITQYYIKTLSFLLSK